MSAEYAPGTVAMIRHTRQSGERRAMRVGNIGWHLRPSTDAEEESGHDFVLDDNVTNVRPLVVLDPEDTERMARLAVQILSDRCNGNITYTTLAHSLRCFDAPPKPAEPTGLGAVVEDADGERWVLYTYTGDTAPWTDGSTSAEWDDVSAVRVLSKGVSA